MTKKEHNAHEKVEKNIGLMAALIAVAVSFGGLAEIVPLMYQAEAIEPLPGVKPYPALELAGRDIYVREGCYNCHSQMIRTLRFETERYGHYSLAGESVYDRPFQWGSKRTGPDLARVGGRYSDDWHRVHLLDPRAVVPESNMPAFPWLEHAPVNADSVVDRMAALRSIGDPYTDEDIAGAAAAVTGKSELDAVVAYLQGLGRHVGTSTAVPAPLSSADVSDTTHTIATTTADAAAKGE